MLALYSRPSFLSCSSARPGGSSARRPAGSIARDRPSAWAERLSACLPTTGPRSGDTPSPWARSAARVRLIDQLGVAPSRMARSGFHNNAHRTKDRTRAFRSRSRLLFPARLCLRRPRLAAGAAAAHGRTPRNRVLAAHAGRMPPRKDPRRSSERTYLRPLMAALSAPPLSVETSAQQLLPSCSHRANSMPSA